MNQWQYDTICATLKSGVPALADTLIEAMKSLVEDYQSKCRELEDTKVELESCQKKPSAEISGSKKEKNK